MDAIDVEAILAEAMKAHREGDLELAANGYDRVIEADPVNGQALFMRGAVHLQRGQNDAAADLLGRAVAVRPDDARALSNYGLALTGLGRLDEAVEALRRATELGPTSADTWGNLGNALRRQQDYGGAIKAYQRTLELAPERAGIHSALGVSLGERERFDEAFESHQRAIRLAPGRADYRNNLSVTLRKAGRIADAEEMLRLAVDLSPEEGEYHAALGSILRRTGRTEEAVKAYRLAREHGSESPNLDQRLQFVSNYVDQPPDVAFADALAVARRLSEGITQYTSFDNDRDPDRPLRVGLVSADLRQHPVGRFLTAPLAAVDQTRYPLFAYSGSDTGDLVNERLKSIIPRWRNTGGVSDEALAEMIRADKIDVLVDLSGATNGSRLGVFARRPAPVSVSYLGYFATTGLDTIDYVLANRWLIPDDERPQWVEQPWHFPGAHLCLEMNVRTPDVGPLPHLTAGTFTFGSFNNVSKFSARTLDAWGEILRQVSASRLSLRTPADNLEPQKEITSQMAARGIAAERIRFEPYVSDYYQHLAGYGQVDLALDPFPYNGGTTTVEALFMGVPVLTVHGASYVSHMSESILRAAGLDEWVTKDVDAYIEKAVTAASAQESLATLRSRLRQQVLASPLFDGPAFARDLEEAFRGMWRAWSVAG